MAEKGLALVEARVDILWAEDHQEVLINRAQGFGGSYELCSFFHNSYGENGFVHHFYNGEDQEENARSGNPNLLYFQGPMNSPPPHEERQCG